MESHQLLDDDLFESQFESGAFPVSNFSHEAHLRLVWIHLNKYGMDQSIRNITSQLNKFVIKAGAKEKYNATLTIAAIKTVWYFTENSSNKDFKTLLKAEPRLSSDFKGLLLTHYSASLLFSDSAKENYIAPDLLPY